MNISTGMGFLLKPELAVLSPLSLRESLNRELLLSRLSNRCSSNDRFAGLRGDLGGEERPGGLDGTGLLFPLPLFDGERLKRVIQEADAGSRSICEPRVEDDQRERRVRSGVGCSSESASMLTPICEVSISKEKADVGEPGREPALMLVCEYMLAL